MPAYFLYSHHTSCRLIESSKVLCLLAPNLLNMTSENLETFTLDDNTLAASWLDD